MKTKHKKKLSYKQNKEHAEDMSYENEIDKSFLNDLLNNTPHEKQFEEDLDKE